MLTVIRISDPELETLRVQALHFLREARYKQALAVLEKMLDSGALSLVERLYILAQRALALALWRQYEAAIDEASQILALVRAEVDDLVAGTIDWEYERAQDVGHLRFLSDVFQFRGLLYQWLNNLPRAVEDLTLSIYMHQNGVNHLMRAWALLEDQECLGQAQQDLQQALQLEPALLASCLGLAGAPVSEGVFELQEQGVVFVTPEQRVAVDPQHLRRQFTEMGPQWLRLAIFFEIAEKQV